ncbi:MAG: hypothetical protein PUD25_02795 [Bacilli bacterium]|nr:hypothetical protein [Bacilli bacterium]
MRWHKFLCSILIIGFLSGCQENRFKVKEVGSHSLKKIIEPKVEEKIPVGLYLSNLKTKTLVSNYTSPLTLYKDIVSLEVFYTNNPSLEGEQVNLWNQYCDGKKAGLYKIGYIIEYKIDDREVRQVILSPHDTEAIFNDIQIYLYDDIHQDKKVYSHVTNDDYDKDTVFTSIKLTASTNIDKVSSPITLTVFVYDDKNTSKELGGYKAVIQRK